MGKYTYNKRILPKNIVFMVEKNPLFGVEIFNVKKN